MTERTNAGPRPRLLHASGAIGGGGGWAGGSEAGHVIRVAIAHGDPDVRSELRVVLERQPGIAVVAEATTGDEALFLARQVGPDVVAMDVSLPGVGCVEATRGLGATVGPRVMLLSSGEPDPRVFAALQAGARGVRRASAAPSELVRAVRLIACGRPLRSRHRTHPSDAKEEPMLSPKVVEIRRGSAHGATVTCPAAVSPDRERRQRWNSAI
jgi:DNA-binding NarL/FixJ family response regulator